MLTKIALVASIILPLWNIPLICRMIKRGSSKDLSLYWAFGVWTCFALMFPAGIRSEDTVWRTFNIVNMVLFSIVVITAAALRVKEKDNTGNRPDTDFYDVIRRRTCIRKYKAGSVGKQQLQRLVDAGRRAPTARAVEPWEFIIVQDKEVLKKLSEVATNGSFLCHAQAAILVFCKNTKYYLEDGCAATENILLAAEYEQLGACWIAGDKKDYAPDVAKMVNAPQGMRLVSIISVGIGNEAKAQEKNRELEEVIHWETFK